VAGLTANICRTALLALLVSAAHAQDLPIPDPVAPARATRDDASRYNAPAPISPISPIRAPASAPSRIEPVNTQIRPIAPISTDLDIPAPVTQSGSRPQARSHLPDTAAPATAAPPAAQASIDGAIAAVGPGDTLNITILGPNGSETRVTVDAEGQIVAPLIGDLRVSGLTPSAIGKRIAQDLRNKGYMTDPQVTVEVVAFRSRIVSVLGQVQRPGRYPIEGRMSVLELLAMAGGATDGAGEVATLVRRADGGNERLNLYVNNGQAPSRPLQDTELEPGDVVFVPEAPRFYVYGEVGKPGAYPIEKGLNVMRALSVAGGLTPRASDSRIDIHRTDPLTGATTDKRVSLTDTVQPGDVIHVNERFF
ncbi:putative capsular polysaccharide export protein, partial [Bordetella avium 197N]